MTVVSGGGEGDVEGSGILASQSFSKAIALSPSPGAGGDSVDYSWGGTSFKTFSARVGLSDSVDPKMVFRIRVVVYNAAAPDPSFEQDIQFPQTANITVSVSGASRLQLSVEVVRGGSLSAAHLVHQVVFADPLLDTIDA